MTKFFTITLLLAALLPSCHPIESPNTTIPDQTSNTPTLTLTETPNTPEATPPPPPTPSTPTSPPAIAQTTINGISFHGVAFDSRTHALNVIDQPNGPGSTYSTARDAAQNHSALLAINAGFFTPEGKPLGLVISNGSTTGSWNSASSLGSGIYRIDTSSNASITRRSSRAAVSNSSQLLQAGPLLIENASSVSSLDSSKSAVRSLIITDGQSRWWIGKTSSCSLAALATALAQSSPASWKPQIALNLDGGRSTDLFISSNIPGGPSEHRSFLNRPVRNFLILVPR